MEKVDLKTKILLYVDNGQFHYMAQHLSKFFKKVFYYSRWDCQGYPDPDNRYPGYGFPEITTIDYMFAKDDKIGYDPDKIDLFAFGDLYYYDIQELLVQMGKRVWGMKSAELLEIDRWFFSKKLKELGLPTVRMQHCIGIDELSRCLKNSPNTYVKLSKYRGARETFCNEDYETSKNILDKLRFKYGDLSKLMEFVIWDDIKTEIPELGWDGYTIDGQYPEVTTFGLELKRKAFLMKILPYDELPQIIKTINEKFSSYLKKCQARGFMSTEVRMKTKTLGYYIDACMRSPSPPCEIYPNMIENIAEIMWYGAEGIMIEPKYAGKYAGQVNIYSDNLENGDPTTIEFPNDIKDNVKVMFACKIDNKITCIPQGSRFAKLGAIVAIGNTLNEVTEKLDKYSKKIKGFEIEINTTDQVLEEAKKLEKIGINF
jgi:hypothetical protein